MILASADEMNISKLAEMADRIMDVATSMVTAVTTSTEDARICKYSEKRSIRPFQHNTGHFQFSVDFEPLSIFGRLPVLPEHN